MKALTTLKRTIQALSYSGIVLIIYGVFAFKIFPRVGGLPVFVTYFLTAVAGILWLVGLCAIMLGENKQ